MAVNVVDTFYLTDAAAKVGALYPASVQTLVGKKHLANFGKPPRFIWIAGNRTPALLNNRADPGANPQIYGYDNALAFIHCWATTENLAWRMAMSLTGAIRKVMGVTNYERKGIQPIELDDSLAAQGYLVVATFSLWLPNYEIDLSTAAFEDQIDPTAVLSKQNQPGIFDASGATEGDGILQPGEQ